MSKQQRQLKGKSDADLVSYLSKIVSFKARRFLKEYSRRHGRELLTLDTTYENSDYCYKDLVADQRPGTEFIVIEGGTQNSWSNLFHHPGLHKAIEDLTDKQKDVIRSVIIEGMSETEYARTRGVSQQAVSKAKRTALNTLRKALERGA